TAKHLQYAVYEAGQSTPLKVFGDETTVMGEAEMNNLKQTVSLKLTTGKTYDVIFWADATTDSPYTFNPASQEVSVDYSKVNNNSDNCDAFFKKETITVSGNQSVDVKLTRPFAQVNIGTDDFDAAKASGLEVTQTEVVAKAFATLNLATGKVADEADRTFTMKAIPTASDGEFPVAGGYKYLSMDYLLVGADKATVDVAFNYGGPQNRTFTNVPVQRNYRTNIYGSLLTNTTDFNVVIEPAFSGEFAHEVVSISTFAALKAAATAGGDVKLESAIDFTQAVTVDNNKTLTVDLNKQDVANATDLWDKAPNQWSLFSVRRGSTLTLKGDGEVIAKANDCYAVDVQDGGHLVIEDGHYNGNIHAVYVKEGTAEIKGGTFEVQQKFPDADKADEFVLNCYDVNYINGTAKIIVSGGTFIGFNPGNCKAEDKNGTNFLAPGYASVADGTTADGRVIYKVIQAPTTRSEIINLLSKDGGSICIGSDYEGGAYLSKDGVTASFAISNNAVVTPLQKKSQRSTFNIDGTNLNLFGNGKILGPCNVTDSDEGAIWVQGGSTLNISGNLSIEGGTGGHLNACVIIFNGTTNIQNGYFHSSIDKNGDSNPCIILAPIKSPTVTGYSKLNIYGGVFEADGDAKFVINCQDEDKDRCTVKVMGGIFVGFNPADNTADGAHTNYVAPGYKSVETTYNGKQAWKVVKE
uniref:DUF6562 domain-containing protein n=1 Tax=Candidatus Limisoma sp. TaxID=3076476 RepID=UPI004027D251